MWKKRIITPIGKIVFIKTLVLLLFNHLFVSLPNPPKSYIQQIETLFFDFIWQGSFKVKKDVLIKNKKRWRSGHDRFKCIYICIINYLD
jgi:hypothetical protein